MWDKSLYLRMTTFDSCYEQHNKISLAISNGKANPLQAWRDPEGSKSLRLPYFKTIGT
jgi:hypothetical protein